MCYFMWEEDGKKYVLFHVGEDDKINLFEVKGGW